MSDFTTIRENVFIGVDVGSSSVRAIGVRAGSGQRSLSTVLSPCVRPIAIRNPRPDFYEQSSVEIWDAVCGVVNELLTKHAIPPAAVKGLGFDATCSLVVVGPEGSRLPVSDSPEHDIIMWKDHRAKVEADEINALALDCLQFVGGAVSVEMEPPKLKWLRRHRPDSYNSAEYFMDLTDWLTFMATGSSSRSLCTVVCKWLYTGTAGHAGWDNSVLQLIGLPELCENRFTKIGAQIVEPGQKIGYLDANTAAKMGLISGVPVAAGLIDAHAGALALLGTRVPSSDIQEVPWAHRLAIISGTSACHIRLAEQPSFVPGVWGPYLGAMLPGYYMNEGGQSALGPVLDLVVRQYVAHVHNDVRPVVEAEWHQWTRDQCDKYADKFGACALERLAEDIHVWPDYQGNRSPYANPAMTAGVIGLTLESKNEDQPYLDSSMSNLLKFYIAHIQALAMMSRLILDTMEEQQKETGGIRFKMIYLCGGLQKNEFYVRALATACQLPVVVPSTDECVAHGSAMLGAVAGGTFGTLTDASAALSTPGTLELPSDELKSFYKRKYRIFQKFGELVKESVQ